MAQVFDDHIVIYAVAHTKRKPGYWRERLNDAVQHDKGRGRIAASHDEIALGLGSFYHCRKQRPPLFSLNSGGLDLF